MRKFKLGEKHPKKNLYRIVALRDFSDVKAGDHGGWVASEHNLSHDGNAWVYDDAEVRGSASVNDNATIYDNAVVAGNANVYSNAVVSDSAVVSHWAIINDNARIYGNACVRDNARVAGAALVYDNAVVSGSAKVYDSAEVYGRAKLYGNAKVYNKANVYGDARIGQSLHIKYGACTTTPNIAQLLQLSIGVGAVNGIVRLYKRVMKNYASEHDKRFIYPSSGFGVVFPTSCHPDPTVSCGSGLHFSHVNYGSWINDNEHVYLAADIHVDDIICVQEGKVRCKKATIIGDVQNGLTKANKPGKMSGLTKRKSDMAKSTKQSQTRYAVVARSTNKVLKNAGTRDEARAWKRNSGKTGLAILDRNTNSMIS